MIYQKNEVLLKVDNVSLQYGDKLILRDINFNIKNIVRPNISQGQVVSLVGQSGIGKTQLFRILSGLNPPTSGKVLVGQKQEEVKEGDMGVVFQNYPLFEHRRIRKILQLSAEKNPSINNSEIKEYIDFYADKFNLKEHLDKFPSQLSGGQRQRSSIVMTLLNGCDFILFDEPFSGLDVKMVKKTLDVFRTISTSNDMKTLIVVSHDLESSCAISDTVLVMAKEDGKEGATITKEIDLIEKGLCWSEDIRKNPEFWNTLEEIENYI